MRITDFFQLYVMSETIRVIGKIVRPRVGSNLCNRKYDCRENWTTRSYVTRVTIITKKKMNGNFRQNETYLGFVFSMTKFNEKKLFPKGLGI